LGKAEQSIIIKASPEKVWELLAFDRLPEWIEEYSHHERVEYTSKVHTPHDKYRIDATAEGIPKKPGDDYCRFEMIESREHEKLSFRAWEETKYFGTLSMLITFSLESVGTDTQLTYELVSEKFFGIFGPFIEKVYLRRWADKQMQKAFENLKSIVEK
jgi:hypothetical protein